MTSRMTVSRYKATRFWAVWDAAGTLVCVCVYKCGAEEVKRRISMPPPVDPDPFWDPRLAFLAAVASTAAAPTGAKENPGYG